MRHRRCAAEHSSMVHLQVLLWAESCAAARTWLEQPGSGACHGPWGAACEPPGALLSLGGGVGWEAVCLPVEIITDLGIPLPPVRCC